MPTVREILAGMESGPEPSGQEKILEAAQRANADLGLGRLGSGPSDTAGSLLRSSAGVAAQVIPSLLLGPEAGIIAKLLTAGGGSVAGGAISRGTVTPETAGLDFLLGAGTEGGAQLGGGIIRRMTGKTGLVEEGAAAERQAAGNVDLARTGAIQEQKAKLADIAKVTEEKALQEQAAAEAKLSSRRDAFQAQILKHSENAAADIRDEELAKQVRHSLGVPTALENPTIETLSARVAPVRESVERSVRGVFRGLSGKFENTLQPYYHLPVEGNFADAVEAERSILEANKETVSSKMTGLMREVEGLQPRDNAAPLGTNRPGQMTQAEIGRRVRGIMGGSEASTTVRDVDGIRRKLTATVTGDGSPVDKRVANRLIRSIDESLQPVLPENVQADWANLRREWREANNVFSPNFRSTLFRADTPAAAADVLYGAAKGGKAHRVLAVVAQTPKDEVPLLRSAFADRLAQGDVVKNVEGVDPRVFKALFSGTGFENPKAWTDSMRTNLVERLGLDEITADPALNARFNSRIQEGMRSFGLRRYQGAVTRAEQQLRSVKNPGDAVASALKSELTPEQHADEVVSGSNQYKALESPPEARLRGEMEGMKTPILGKRMQGYIEHRTAFHTALGVLSLGALGGSMIHHPVAAMVPLAYLGGSKAANAALSNPAVAKIWHNALTSKNWEQAGFWIGRLAAASLTEGIRSSDDSE